MLSSKRLTRGQDWEEIRCLRLLGYIALIWHCHYYYSFMSDAELKWSHNICRFCIIVFRCNKTILFVANLDQNAIKTREKELTNIGM